MHLRRLFFCLSASLLIVLGASASARADTVVITSGSLNATGLHSFTHPFGFSFTGAGFQSSGGGEPFIYRSGDCGSGARCAPGAVVNADGLASFGITALCNLTHQGMSRPVVGCRGSGLEFSSDPVTLPLTLGSSFSVTTNFNMTGTFLFTDLTSNNSFEVAVRGQGTASIELILWVDGSHRVTSVTYNFAPEPVPEPATALLMVTGLAGMAWAARRRRTAGGGD